MTNNNIEKESTFYKINRGILHYHYWATSWLSDSGFWIISFAVLQIPAFLEGSNYPSNMITIFPPEGIDWLDRPFVSTILAEKPRKICAMG
jgi:hypothetical protein